MNEAGFVADEIRSVDHRQNDHHQHNGARSDQPKVKRNLFFGFCVLVMEQLQFFLADQLTRAHQHLAVVPLFVNDIDVVSRFAKRFQCSRSVVSQSWFDAGSQPRFDWRLDRRQQRHGFPRRRNSSSGFHHRFKMDVSNARDHGGVRVVVLDRQSLTGAQLASFEGARINDSGVVEDLKQLLELCQQASDAFDSSLLGNAIRRLIGRSHQTKQRLILFFGSRDGGFITRFAFVCQPEPEHGLQLIRQAFE